MVATVLFFVLEGRVEDLGPEGASLHTTELYKNKHHDNLKRQSEAYARSGVEIETYARSGVEILPCPFLAK
jgi:hypothetical protein